MKPKFRAWLKEENEMIIVDTMNWFDDEFESIGDGVTFLRGAEKIELMQSTGLCDKNGKEIFEGDILKFNDEWADYGYEGYVEGSIDGINYVEIKAEITYFTFGKTRIPESSLTDLVENEHYSFEELMNEKSYEFEIIGNIYENPELLEVENEQRKDLCPL